MAEVKIDVCKVCKKLFHSLKEEKICPDCKEEQADEFRKVKQYIREHKGAGIEEVSQACEVSHKQLLNWVREERLYFDDAAKVALPCLRCGKGISMGKYCNECLANYKDEVSAMETKKTEEKPQGQYAMAKGKISYLSQKK